MPRCIVNGCPHTTRKLNPGVTLHVFPKDVTRIKQWLLQTGQHFGDLDAFVQRILDGKKYNNFRLCSVHFSPSNYFSQGINQFLRPDALPTLFPGMVPPPVLTQPFFPSISIKTETDDSGRYLPITNAMSCDNANLSTAVTVIKRVSSRADTCTRLKNVGTSTSPYYGVKNAKTQTVCARKDASMWTDISYGKKEASTCTDPSLGKRNAWTSTLFLMVDSCTDPIRLMVDKVVQWPEYENNFNGEPWKVNLDHFYAVRPSSQAKCSQVNPLSSRADYIHSLASQELNVDLTEEEMLSLLQHLTKSLKKKVLTMGKKTVTEKILNQALELLYLLTGEDYLIVKKNSLHSNIHQLNGEVPIKCGDVAVYFSMEEWEYIEGHKELYKDVMMETPESVGITGNRSCGLYEENLNAPLISERGEYEDYKDEDLKVQMEADICEDLFQENPEIESIGKNEIDKDTVETQSGTDLYNENVDTASVCEQDEEEMDDKLAVHIAIKQVSCAGVYERDPDSASECEQEEDEMALGADRPIKFEESDTEDWKVKTDFTPKNFSTTLSSHYEQEPVRARESSLNGSSYFSRINLNNNIQMAVNSPSYNMKPPYMDLSASSSEEKRHTCGECGKDFAYKCRLVAHQRIHKGEKPHRCQDCGKQFVYKTSLLAHQKIHIGDKPNQCDVCGKQFVYKSNLLVHQRIHQGEKPHECGQCGKQFVYRANLLAHQRTHNWEKQYPCVYCGKRFAYKCRLIGHQRTHTGEKPQKSH
ncbi:uncharacterized protein O3C94_021393 isoform 1-T2 [Discoglossus pictus]